MTTTVTVKTHTWPVAVEIYGHSNYSSPQHRSYGHSNETRFQAANSVKDYTVSSSASVTVRELPEGVTSLDDADLPTSMGADPAGFDDASAKLGTATA